MAVDPAQAATPATGGELAQLIAEQARDDATDRLPRDRRVTREADLDAGRDPRTGWRRRADLRRFDDASLSRDRPATKWHGRGRKVAIRDDTGAWHDTERAGRHVGFWVLLIGVHPWEAAIHDAVLDGRCDCPVCSGRIRSRGHYCTYCDRCGLDDLVEQGKLELWGLKPDTVLNPIASTYPAVATKAPRNGRRGGLGR